MFKGLYLKFIELLLSFIVALEMHVSQSVVAQEKKTLLSLGMCINDCILKSLWPMPRYESQSTSVTAMPTGIHAACLPKQVVHKTHQKESRVGSYTPLYSTSK